MESSEDDAGAATNASRRISARENDIGQFEDVDASTSFQRDSSEDRTSCKTQTMSEDNFDGDSVPSPSTQDVNTSTEAILDMIDEFVDGPGARKRLSTVEENIGDNRTLFSSIEITKTEPNNVPMSSVACCVAGSATNEPTTLASTSSTLVECMFQSEMSNDKTPEIPLQIKSFDMVPTLPQEQSEISLETNLCSENITPSSSVLENIPNVSESLSEVRTVKCTTSSVIHDKVTIESAESTSNDSNISEGKVLVTDSVTRSPLRRRLVRPPPVDRRPECTVSSTGDSEIFIQVNEPGESVAKDVSSSSDAVPTVHGNIKEKVSNISQISVCQAETSDSSNSPKKIKLIRQKIMPSTSHGADVSKPVVTQIEQCQSTSDNFTTKTESTEFKNYSSITLDSKKISNTDNKVSVDDNENLKSIALLAENDNKDKESVSNEVCQMIDTLMVKSIHDDALKAGPSVTLSLSKTPTIEALTESNKPSNIINALEKTEKVPPLKLNLSTSNVSECELANPAVSIESIAEKVPPLKLNLSASYDSSPEKAVTSNFPDEIHGKVPPLKLQLLSNLLEHKSIITENKIEKVPPLKLNISSSNVHTPLNISDVASNITDFSKHKSNLVSISDKVPPLKLNLNSSNKIDIDSAEQDESCESMSEKIQTFKLNISTANSLDSEVKLNAQCLPINLIEMKSEKVPPLKINLSMSNLTEASKDIICDPSEQIYNCESNLECKSDLLKQVPKLTIKLGSKQSDEMKSPIPKVTIKPLKPPSEVLEVSNKQCKDQVPCVTKLNIKPILRPPEKINDIHRKSSSSEISESEYSETDDTTSTSDQASTSDHGPPDVVPKVTIRLGKPGTESEGKFYAEQATSIKEYQLSENNEKDHSISKLKHSMVCQPEELHVEKIPKLTIKTISKLENQPLSPKLLIKLSKPPDSNKDSVIDQGDTQIPKLKISTETKLLADELSENVHNTMPKFTIKPVVKAESSVPNKLKKSVISSTSDQFPVVTKLNIKPIVKPDHIESTENVEEKVPIVSKLNIKPIINPECRESDSVEEVPKITKLNIKPLKSPENKDNDEWTVNSEKEMPFITKLNIKPISRPAEIINNSENLSPETGNSSDDNTEFLPVVTKLNIKPILKPELDDKTRLKKISNEDNIPVITKINIKPVIDPNIEKPLDKNILGADTNFLKCEELQEVSKAEDTQPKNPPLIMKINRSVMGASTEDKLNHVDSTKGSIVSEGISVVSKINIKPIISPSNLPISTAGEAIINSLHSSNKKTEISQVNKPKIIQNCMSSSDDQRTNIDTEKAEGEHQKVFFPVDCELLSPMKTNDVESNITSIKLDIAPREPQLLGAVNSIENVDSDINFEISNLPTEVLKHSNVKHKSSTQNCFLLKQLLESNKCLSQKNIEGIDRSVNSLSPLEQSLTVQKIINCDPQGAVASKELDLKHCLEKPIEDNVPKQISPVLMSEAKTENLAKPLEIIVSEQLNQSSGQDSPRIILKINKTDHGSSAKIITEDNRRPESPLLNSVDLVNDKAIPKKGTIHSRRKISSDTITSSLVVGKRLRSSRIINETEKSPMIKRNIGRKSVAMSLSPPESKEPEFSNLESKRLKLGKLLSNKALTVNPVISKVSNITPSNVNHSLLNNENCSKNGNSKLHDILSNLTAKQKNDTALKDKQAVDLNLSAVDYNTSGTNSDIIEIDSVENSHPKVQEMIINENTLSHDFILCEESTDPLEVESSKFTLDVTNDSSNIPKTLEITPTPKKRGRPRKIPLIDGPKTIVLPTPALEERPQRSLRLSRDRPAILAKPRGRGRGRGIKRATANQQEPEKVVETANKFFTCPEKLAEEEDPTSSRVKLPRMTEALDKMPSCTTPLSSRRRNSSSSDLKLFETPELKVMLEDTLKSPESTASGGERRGRGMRGRGSRGGRGRTPRGRGRGRGGGRGAVYMKETMGIYGRVCGPATTTVQLFEEETCMMDDNATPSKPSHLIDEDSQSSVKSSTNESSKMRKSKFADLFDSSKIWTAADVKEYEWPLTAAPDAERQVMMIQEQVAIFLGIKSFKRRYPELKRRSILGEEKDYVLSKNLATEALCDLGITAVDASEILDIMLSDYPHKYEEYRSHQRERQLTEATAEVEEESQAEEKVEKVEVKQELKVEIKPEAPKVDPEKTRQDMAAAAVAAASEWNTRLNAQRRGACVDLQSLTVLRPRAPPVAPRAPHCRPPAGFYPHALLPGQYQHWYRCYTPQQLRYFPLNTVVSAPPPAPEPASSSDSEPEWSSSDQDSDTQHQPKRRKLMKKRTSQGESSREESIKETKENEAELCRVCRLREEGNRKYSHERFLVCSNCNAKLHPGCVELGADTIRKCREYAWQCAECKWCCACRRPADDDKMLFCDLCDRGFHIYCVGLHTVPNGRWHCVECAVCKSCGAREPGGLAGGVGSAGGSEGEPPAWHHQTRRGPGGHKLYSHSLCTPCARAYRIGRYCPLCDRSFVGPKGTMQLVICKLCDRQLHQDCVKQTVSQLSVLDYTCGECRRGGITSRAAAARLAPRTIATLFMAKRRFNKYAHRQYMESRRATPSAPAPSPAPSPASAPADPLATDPAH